jgi:hypothetical protein
MTAALKNFRPGLSLPEMEKFLCDLWDLGGG